MTITLTGARVAVNPGTLIYFTALLLGDRSSGGGLAVLPPAESAVGAFAASASWQLLLAGGGAMLARWGTGPRGQLLVALVSASVMIGLAGRVLFS